VEKLWKALDSGHSGRAECCEKSSTAISARASKNEAITKLVPSAEADFSLVHFRPPGTAVPGFRMPPLRG